MTRKAHIRCGKLFDGANDRVLENQTIVAEGETIVRIAPSAQVPKADGVTEFDHSARFVMPGLIDVHTHMSYGNAKSEEDIDLYCPTELRAIRGMYFAHQIVAAGVTSVIEPGGSGLLSLSVRNAIDAGLFEGPNVTAAGPYITSRQGLTDWYPTWIGVPSTSIGRLVKSRDEAVEEVRRQVKDGVDAVKIALDGIQKRPNGEFVAAFTLDETKAMVDEIHRLGKIAIVHARGREATLYAGKAGVDLIFHASYMDDEGLEAVLANKCMISPTLTLLCNTIDFVEPQDPWHGKGRPSVYQEELDAAKVALRKARKAGVPMPTGTDSGFAITPYGEWHARELEIYVEHLGFTPIEALKSATSVSARLLRARDKAGTLAPGYRADAIAVDGDPTKNVSVLLEPGKIVQVLRGASPVPPARHSPLERKVSDFQMNMLSDLYTRARVAELRQSKTATAKG